MTIRLALAAALLAASLSGCWYYKPEVRQGTPLTKEMIAGLKQGMTKRQVRLLIGSPPVSDTFHTDRWDYIETTGRAGESVAVPPRLTLYFKDDQLVSASGELAPVTLSKPAASPAAPAQ